NRREWARYKCSFLEVPNHTPIASSDGVDANRDSDLVEVFTRYLATLQDDYDFIVIDTPGSVSHLSLVAHGMADTIITPINDSFVDLDVIVTIGSTIDLDPTPSRYARAVATALEGRRAVCGCATDWIVFRNRLATLASRNHKQITRALTAIAPEVGFRLAPGLSERVIFREFFPSGLTAFDQLDELPSGSNPSMSRLMARMEMRELIEGIGLLHPDASATEK